MVDQVPVDFPDPLVPDLEDFLVLSSGLGSGLEVCPEYFSVSFCL